MKCRSEQGLAQSHVRYRSVLLFRHARELPPGGQFLVDPLDEWVEHPLEPVFQLSELRHVETSTSITNIRILRECIEPLLKPLPFRWLSRQFPGREERLGVPRPVGRRTR